jgi:serine/threonine-protein kinase RsbW
MPSTGAAPMSQRFSLSISSRVDKLSEIADFVEQAARSSGLNAQQVYDVQMAVDEASTNIIEHAYHGQVDGIIAITCEQRGKEFVVVLQDFGDPFNPQKVTKPRTRAPLSRRNIGGLGLFFMHKLMDRVEFDFSSKNGNRLTMIKKIRK